MLHTNYTRVSTRKIKNPQVEEKWRRMDECWTCPELE
jgi:hypothetical protein